jgi:hypothetical protein
MCVRLCKFSPNRGNNNKPEARPKERKEKGNVRYFLFRFFFISPVCFLYERSGIVEIRSERHLCRPLFFSLSLVTP